MARHPGRDLTRFVPEGQPGTRVGEAGWPRKSSTSGVIDLVSFPDDGYRFYRSQWTEEPMIHLLPHWNWSGREGQMSPVLAYTNVDAVDLYLNEGFMGEKRLEFPRQGTSGGWNSYDQPQVFPTTADLHLSWDVPYWMRRAWSYRMRTT